MLRYAGLLALVISTMAVGCTTSEDTGPATRNQCQKVQEHSAELRLASVSKNSKLSEDDLAKHQANFSRVTEASLDSCVETRDRAWANCMLNAESVSAARECE